MTKEGLGGVIGNGGMIGMSNLEIIQHASRKRVTSVETNMGESSARKAMAGIISQVSVKRIEE